MSKQENVPAAPTKAGRTKKPSPRKSPPQVLPPWKVLLHNDDVNTYDYVVLTIVQLAKLNQKDAQARTLEADENGTALILVTHKERAELFQEQFTSKGLTVTIEPGA